MPDKGIRRVDRSERATRLGRRSLLRFSQERNIVVLNPTFPSIPPLVFGVNPDSLNRTFAKNVNTTQTRGGVIQEHWGVDQLTQLSGSGSTLGFGLPLLRDDSAVPDSAARGIWELQAGFVRHETIAGEDFHHLIQMFLNDGSQYNPQTGQPDTWQELLMWFMGDAYLGYFTSLDWSEEADQPFRWLYSFAFTVTFTFLNRPTVVDTRPVAGSPGQSRRSPEQDTQEEFRLVKKVPEENALDAFN